MSDKKIHICDINMNANYLGWILDLTKKGYLKTGLKFAVNFNGSKGYLDHIEIISEGPQTTGKNFLSRADILSEDLKKFSVFFISGQGVQIEKQG